MAPNRRAFKKPKIKFDFAKEEALIQNGETPIIISGPGIKDEITTSRELRIKKELKKIAELTNTLIDADQEGRLK